MLKSLSQNYTSLLQLLQDETNQNADMYATLIGYADKEAMSAMIGNYVYSKHYKNKYADLLPFIVSNALHDRGRIWWWQSIQEIT